ncbi:MAG: hypothetical protein WB630_20905 [Candidatus Acidiferrales bacterium]
MRVTISHNRSKTEIVDAVDRSFDKMLQQDASLPVRFELKQKAWQGSTLSFALSAKLGVLSSPIRGTVEVTDHDLTVDADLGILNRLVSDKTVRDVFGSRIKGLLN